MILYNVTVKVDSDIHTEWLLWMQQIHIPSVMQTGLFTGNKIFRLLDQDEEDGITYAIQYECSSLDDLRQYQNEHASILQKEHTDKYQSRFAAFRTIMEQVVS